MQMVAGIPNIHKQEHSLPSYPPNKKPNFLEAVLTADNYNDKCREQGTHSTPQPHITRLQPGQAEG